MIDLKYYTVYHDDEIVAFGSAAQCTQKLGLKTIRGFHALVSKSKSGLLKHYAVIVEDVESGPDSSLD